MTMTVLTTRMKSVIPFFINVRVIQPFVPTHTAKPVKVMSHVRKIAHKQRISFAVRLLAQMVR